MFAATEARLAVRSGWCRQNLRAVGSDLGLTPVLGGRHVTRALCGRQGDTRLVGVEKPAVKEDAPHEPGGLEQTRREPYRNVVRNDAREQPGQP